MSPKGTKHSQYINLSQININVAFDGDNITVRIILIKQVAKAFGRLGVRAAALDITEEGKFSHIVSIPQPTIMAWGNYLRGVDKMS